MKARLVKFDEDGTVCNNDINYLRRHPECGIFFIQDKPFEPDDPKNKFKKLDRKFNIRGDVDVPETPDIPKPPQFKKVGLTGQVITDTDDDFLPQDTTNTSLGRRLIGEHLENKMERMYSRIPVESERGLVPRIGNESYSHEDIERPTRPVGEVELEDFGAGVGIVNNEPPSIIQTRIRPLPDPRDTEFIEQQMKDIARYSSITNEEFIEQQMKDIARYSSITNEELIEQQIKDTGKRVTLPKRRVPVPEIEGTELIVVEPEKEEILIVREAERFVRKGRPQISEREVEQIVDEFAKKGINRKSVIDILEEHKLYDSQGEFELRQIADPKQRAFFRRMRAQEIIRQQSRPDSNLLPQRQQEIELSEDVPLIQDRTDIAEGKSGVEKVIDKVAGKLPEEYRTKIGSLKTKGIETLQSIKGRTTRIFGQNYKSITGKDIDVELSEINRPNVTEDITGIRTGDLADTDFNVLGRDYAEGFSGVKPKLSFAERLQTVRTSGELAGSVAGGIGGLVAGFGVAELMGKLGVHNNYAIGATSGASAGLGGRILSMAGSRMFGNEAAQVATRTVLSTSRSLISSAAEGGLVGLALVPEDMLLNNAYLNAGMSHAAANVASGLITGGTATTIGAIGAFSLGAAPETIGLSLVVGGIAMGITALVGGLTGAQQDADELEKIKKTNLYATGRKRLLISLQKNDFDFDKALANFAEKDTLGMDDKTWKSFSASAKHIFNPKPSDTPLPPSSSDNEPTDEDKKITDLFDKYVTHNLIKNVCGSNDCKEIKRHDRGELTDDEKQFLDNKTRGTWLRQANMSMELTKQEMKYTQIRINKAQKYMLNAWSKDGKVLTELDPYQVRTARIDPTFIQRYEQAVKIDAQQKVLDAYTKDQTKIEQLPKNVQDMANADQDFSHMIHQYYETMETTSGQLDVTINQLIELQKLEGEAQKDKYQEFQFNNIKQNQNVVEQAKEISKEEDQVREANFYDIDQALFETDPTAINTWHPTDSQILQAHSAGMNLNEYTDYMHQLAKGEAGDYKLLRKYSDTELRASGLLDYSHFQDELQMAGYRKNLYTYNPETRQFTLNPNVTNSAIPSTQESFISRYTPKYLLKARQEYADLIHGLNEKNQKEIDNYNANLTKELSIYGRNYDSIVASINDERLYQGRSDLLFYDVGKIYNQNKLEFNKINSKLSDAPSVNVKSQDEVMGRQLGQQVNLQEKYTLTDDQYRNVKLDLQSKNIKSPDNQQLEQAVQEVKSSPDAPPAAS
jgi:hypothetical protein